MIDFTADEITEINKHMDSISKISLISLYAIYDKYNGTSHTGCWCGVTERKAKHKTFLNWYNENKQQNNDEQTTN